MTYDSLERDMYTELKRNTVIWRGSSAKVYVISKAKKGRHELPLEK